MAKKKGQARTVTIVESDDDDAPAGSGDDAAQAARDFAEANKDEGGALIRITDQLRGTAGAVVQVVRTYPSTPELAGFVGNMTPDEYSEERVEKLYGPGRYRIRFVGPNGFLPGGGALHIARKREDSPGTPEKTGDVASQVAALLKATRDADEQRAKDAAARRDRLLELAIPGVFTLLGSLLARGGGDNAQLITALAAAMKPAPGLTMTDMLGLMVKVQELNKQPESGNQLDQLERIVTLAKEFAGDGGGTEGWAGVAKELVREGLPAARAAFEAITQERQAQRPPLPPPRVTMPGPAAPVQLPQQPVQQQQQPAPPSPAPEAQPSAAPQGQGDDMLGFFMPMIRAQAGRVLVWAQQDRNPAAYAEVLIDEMPENVWAVLTPQRALEMLQSANWWAVVVSQFPDAAPHQKWIGEFRKELIDLLKMRMPESEGLQDSGQQVGGQDE